MSKAVRRVKGESQKEIVRLINSLSGKWSAWEIWQDFIIMSAISLANVFDKQEALEKEYMQRASKYKPQELDVFAKMLAEVVDALDSNPDQDYLGELFMELELGDNWKGQFFTPYCVCKAMAAINCGNIGDTIKQRGWVSVNDPACGAGALLIAVANQCKEQKINYQTDVLFVAQDIDFLAGCMCFIQMCLIGCPGYVVIADTIAHPAQTYDRRGLLPISGQNVLYTPMFFRRQWMFRKAFAKIEVMTAGVQREKEPEEKAEPDKPEVQLHETKSGQLVLF